MGNQCCSGAPCESNQVVTTATREIQKPVEHDFSAKRKVENFNGKDHESEEDQENPKTIDHSVNVYEKNQDEHYPAKTVAIEMDDVPQSDNLGKILFFF